MIPYFQTHIHVYTAIFRNQFFGNIAAGGSQPSAGNDDISAPGSNVQRLFYTNGIISNGSLIQNIKPPEI